MNRSYSFIAILLVALSWSAIRAQEGQNSDAGVTGSPATTQSEFPLQATLLLVNENWSGGENPEEIRREVAAALQGKPIPAEYQENADKFGAKIWFVDDHATIYTPDDLGSLVAWLNQHKLITGTYHGEPYDLVSRPGFAGASQFNYAATKVSIGTDVLPPTAAMPSQPEIPFVRHEQKWAWLAAVRPIPPNQAVDAEEEALNLECGIELRSVYSKDGDERVVDEQQHSVGGAITRLPKGMMAVVPWNLGERASGASSLAGRRPPNTQPIVVLYRAPAPCPWLEADGTNTPRLALPTRLIPLSRRGSSPIMRGGTFDSLRQSAERRESGLSGRGRSTGASSTPPGVTEQEEVRELRTMQLMYAKADNVVNAIQPFFPSVILAADTRVNMLLAQGSADALNEVQAVVKVLDVASPESDAVAGREIDMKDVEEASEYYRRLSRETMELLRNRNKRLSADHPEIVRLRGQLRDTVTELFDARQQMQKAEIAALRKQLEELEQSIQMREQLKEQIIDQRVRELLQ